MRFQFTIALLITLFFSGWYYYSQAHPCISPRTYTLGSVDERFGIDREAVKEIMVEVEAIWETALGRELFTYNESTSFKIDFIYDDRQQRSEEAEATKAALEQKENVSKSVGIEYTKLVAEYDALKKKYESKIIQYNSRLKTFNDTVASYNESGGAPQAVYDDLQKTEKILKVEEVSLEAEASKIKALTQDINGLSARGNNLISEYNDDVIQYNQTYTGSEEFTQGEYRGDSIAIYHFKDNTELKNVLVHEFGHALGLPHVEGKASLMYYLMDKQPTTSKLSPEDLAALGLVCKPNDSMSTRFHQFFSYIFTKLNLI